MLDLRWSGRAFHATVPAVVGVGAVAVKFVIGFVVLLVVGGQVVEGKAVVAGDKVNTAVGLAIGLLVDVGAA